MPQVFRPSFQYLVRTCFFRQNCSHCMQSNLTFMWHKYRLDLCTIKQASHRFMQINTDLFISVRLAIQSFLLSNSCRTEPKCSKLSYLYGESGVGCHIKMVVLILEPWPFCPWQHVAVICLHRGAQLAALPAGVMVWWGLTILFIFDKQLVCKFIV